MSAPRPARWRSTPWGAWLGSMLGAVVAGLLDQVINTLTVLVDALGYHLFGALWVHLKWISAALVGLTVAAVVAPPVAFAWWTVTQLLSTSVQCARVLRRFWDGGASLADVRASFDGAVFLPSWYGPQAAAPFSNDYVQSELKGRGEQRKLNHVLVHVDGMVARLSRRTPKGRTNPHGHTFRYDAIEACSHRRLRSRLSPGGGDIHLCAASPCTAPDAAGVHCGCYAMAPAAAHVDVCDMARAGPFSRWARCLGWCAYGFALRITQAAGSCCCQGACPRRRCAGPRGSRPSPDIAASSDSEPDGDSCGAELVAYRDTKGVVALAPAGCRDVASGESVALLVEDAELSDMQHAEDAHGTKVVPLCKHHRQVYMGTLPGRQCAFTDCRRVGVHSRNGLLVCAEHGRKRGVAWEATPDEKDTSAEVEKNAAPRGRTPDASNERRAASRLPARPAPVLNTVTRDLLDGFAARLPPPVSGEQLLQEYLRVRMESDLSDAAARRRMLTSSPNPNLDDVTLRAALLDAVDETLACPTDLAPEAARALALVAESWRLESEDHNNTASSPCAPAALDPGQATAGPLGSGGFDLQQVLTDWEAARADGFADDADLGVSLALLATHSFPLRMLLTQSGWDGTTFRHEMGAAGVCRAIRMEAYRLPAPPEGAHQLEGPPRQREPPAVRLPVQRPAAPAAAAPELPVPARPAQGPAAALGPAGPPVLSLPPLWARPHRARGPPTSAAPARAPGAPRRLAWALRDLVRLRVPLTQELRRTRRAPSGYRHRPRPQRRTWPPLPRNWAGRGGTTRTRPAPRKAPLPASAGKRASACSSPGRRTT